MNGEGSCRPESTLRSAGSARGPSKSSGSAAAIARPYHGYHPRIHQKAAALVHGIVTNHGFVDGNKRTALYLVELLAVRCGYRLAVEDLVVADIVTAVARGELGYDELAAWFEARLEPFTRAEAHPEAESTDNPLEQRPAPTTPSNPRPEAFATTHHVPSSPRSIRHHR